MEERRSGKEEITQRVTDQSRMLREDIANTEDSGKMSKRDFLKFTGKVSLAGGLVALNVYLRTDEGKKFVGKVIESDFGRKSNIEIDEESRDILNLYNETIEASTEKLGPVEQAAARELAKRRDVVFAAAEIDRYELNISLNIEGEGVPRTIIDYNPTDEKARVDILLPNVPTTSTEKIKHFAHELGHAYQFTALLSEFGYKSKEVDEFMYNYQSSENEMDARIFDNLASYLYSKTHPNDKNYGMIFNPEELGVDELGFVGYWIDRKEEFPQKLTEDLEYRWFLERYDSLVDVALDVFSGEDNGPPLFSPSVRDSEVSEEFIAGARKFIVPCSWSEMLEIEMDPTENNPFILRHFILVEEQYHS